MAGDSGEDDGNVGDVVLNREDGEEKRVSCDGVLLANVVVVRSREDWRRVGCGLVL